MWKLILTHGLRSFQVMMDMKQESCMLKKFHVEEFCRDFVKKT
jgi:hypothetical protein